ncbi:MAG: LPS ABC transporter substrate-binding protein LptA [Hyphomicrobiales bacterium]|nr:LPS ABC transporter substrate-binding protein LptA [Hyphomicrobiales bacterium]MCP4999172.1 LPS ABC transporter substrate-binding protein LptA [Hyphomicrobiales bacterium]
MHCYLRTGLSGLLAVGIFWSGVLSLDANAQQRNSRRLDGLALSGDKPIQIESDKLQVQDDKGTATFSGNVKVVQGNTIMQSGHMIVYYAKDDGSATTGTSEIDRIDVRGKVYIKSDNQEATADKGVFDMKAETVELTGDRVVLSEGDNVLVGCKLTVFMQSGEARLEGCGGRVGGSAGGRVKMQLDPKSRK